MNTFRDEDVHFMREAIALAKMGWGLTNPNPMVGAVIVRDNRIVGRGFHRRAGEFHAEINAINDAVSHGKNITGATLYVNLEPCSSYGRTPPCTDAIIKAAFGRVVIGALDPNSRHNGRGVDILREAGIEVVAGVECAECTELNKYFFRWVSSGKPFVTLKMAMTLDGKIATSSGESKWITGVEARRRVQCLRRMADAIMVGSDTVRRDHPALTVREPENWERQPMRLIASDSMDDDELLEYFPDGRAELVSPGSCDEWDELLRGLGSRGMISLLIEGGGELAASAVAASVVDYVEFHIAPKLLGGRDSRPVLGGVAPESMAMAHNLSKVQVTGCGEDIIVSGYLRESN